MKIEIEVSSEQVIGLPYLECFMCGKKPATRHHAIPCEMKPLRNVTIPLCQEHKDITHHIIKQFYFPKELRNKIGKIKKRSDDIAEITKSIKKELDFGHNPRSTSLLG